MRALPQSIEAERALLGQLIEAPDAIAKVEAILDPKAFYRDDHCNLYALLRQMIRTGAVVDSITVVERVGRDAKPDRFGGVPYVIRLPDLVPSTSNPTYYARLIAGAARRRNLILAARAAEEALYSADEPEAAVAELQEAIALNQSVRTGYWRPLADVLIEAMDDIDERVAGGQSRGLPTGMASLDAYLVGLKPAKLYVLGGRPAMGKTALALELMWAVARQGGSVGMYSLEMPGAELAERGLVNCGRIDNERLRRGDIDSSIQAAIDRAAGDLSSLPIWIDDRGALTIEQIEAGARQLHAQCLRAGQPLRLLSIDYLTLMSFDVGRGDSSATAIGKVTGRLKALSKELSVAVLLLCQLNRDVEKRPNKCPQNSDLRDSGSIEQDADVIMFVFREHVYDSEADAGDLEVIITKQRDGRTGTAHLRFSGPHQRVWCRDDEALGYV
jgi:replicative DNA helicase